MLDLTLETRALKYADQSFDVVIAHTLLSHVDDPLVMLQEARRLLRPGGVVAVFDVDWASLTHDAASEPVSNIGITGGAYLGAVALERGLATSGYLERNRSLHSGGDSQLALRSHVRRFK